jgi:hypothetical protein
MLTTLLKPDAGRVTVFSLDAASRPMLVRRMIGYVPQLLSADAMLTGRENVELFARVFDVPRTRPGRASSGTSGARTGRCPPAARGRRDHAPCPVNSLAVTLGCDRR